MVLDRQEIARAFSRACAKTGKKDGGEYRYYRYNDEQLNKSEARLTRPTPDAGAVRGAFPQGKTVRCMKGHTDNLS